MIHNKRRFSIAAVESAADLAEKLTQHTWCGCNGFQLGELVFLNDSFSADGAQEYAVVYDGKQIESITFGWCSQEKAWELIELMQKEVAENSFTIYSDVTATVEPADKHGRCSLCA